MRRALGGVAVALALAALPQAAAALLVWTFVVVPLTATAGQSTTFTMTATNVIGPDDLGCMEVTLPASFTIESVSDPVADNGGNWQAALGGNTVTVNTLSGGDRLEIGDSVTFQVTATPASAGATSWPNHAHRHQDCSGATEVGVPVQVVVLPQPLPTPTPVPTPRPTPNPTPRPTPLPSLPISLPPLATLLPSLPSGPSARPTATPSGEPRPSAGSSSAPASPSPGPSSSATAGGGVTTPPTSGGGGPTAPRVPAKPAAVQVGGGSLTVLDGFGTWSVPAAVVGVPGLLVVLWVALQTVGALAWIPAVRGLRGEDRGREPKVAR